MHLTSADAGPATKANMRRLDQGCADSSGFHASTTRDESPEGARVVAMAIARAKAGDREALRFLYLRYSNNVYGYVRTIVRNDHEAEDITQDVFAKLMTAIGKYNDRGVPFLRWLLRLARNVAIDHLRRERSTPCAEVFGSEDPLEEDAGDRSRCLHEALDTLPDEQRSVVILRHVIGLSPGEIADRMGRSESAIHGLHHRGRRALRAELGRLETAPATVGRMLRAAA